MSRVVCAGGVSVSVWHANVPQHLHFVTASAVTHLAFAVFATTEKRGREEEGRESGGGGGQENRGGG